MEARQAVGFAVLQSTDEGSKNKKFELSASSFKILFTSPISAGCLATSIPESWMPN
jgi:hypothetical protein